ncbi:hypothetical protein [Sporomusa acidovorans]|uniref:Uncharacterized protein n=1 Tax=Sporomusa acidovorans (strain ATCC 49682 / DSM 3132 / Mol) TaxID=1123286 RepID=A0ABZ3IYK6_SPOA4|nr:hypothetical protein [Sporomusa acidovorans]OZC17690.1 hypothetical protein SPACI_36940 [Sporomusa acidovorans DSM 3132]SDE12151.1 hypothetical protein SAMN04488499_100872 [Sporomusa acidovorans]
MREFCPFNKEDQKCRIDCKLYVYTNDAETEGTCAFTSVACSLADIAKKFWNAV